MVAFGRCLCDGRGEDQHRGSGKASRERLASLVNRFAVGARPICGELASGFRACKRQTGSFHGAGVFRCASDA